MHFVIRQWFFETGLCPTYQTSRLDMRWKKFWYNNCCRCFKKRGRVVGNVLVTDRVKLVHIYLDYYTALISLLCYLTNVNQNVVLWTLTYLCPHCTTSLDSVFHMQAFTALSILLRNSQSTITGNTVGLLQNCLFQVEIGRQDCFFMLKGLSP